MQAVHKKIALNSSNNWTNEICITPKLIYCHVNKKPSEMPIY